MSLLNVLHIKSKTNASCPDLSGLSYTASFDSHAFARGPRKKIYHGHLGGSGPRKGEDAVVKVFRDQMGTEELCDTEIEKHKLARDLADKFNRLVPDERSKVAFTLPMKSRVESLGIGSHFSRRKGHNHHPHRSIDKQEWVLMEENLVKSGEYQVFIRKTGKRLTLDPTSLDAFLHFAYHESDGKFVMCGFQGVHTKRGYTLTTPCFHSVDHRFGWSVDKGYEGILQAFSYHKCNNLCYSLLERPTTVSVDSRGGKCVSDTGGYDDDGDEIDDEYARTDDVVNNVDKNGEGVVGGGGGGSGDVEEDDDAGATMTLTVRKNDEDENDMNGHDDNDDGGGGEGKKNKFGIPAIYNRSNVVAVGTMPKKRPSL